MSSKLEICFFCNQENSDLITFSICSHRICTLCLYERIFANHMQEFQGKTELKIKCKCENGYLNKKLLDLFSLIKRKLQLDEHEIEEKNSENFKIVEGCECISNKNISGQRFSDYFCLDCLKFICKKCKIDVKNTHLKHRILNSKYLIRTLKENIKNIDLKNKTLEDFQEKIENFSLIFEKMINDNFNNTIKNIDNFIESAQNLKKFYIQKYKEELGIYLETFRFIKIFYLNYYNDRKRELKIKEHEKSNIFKLKYLNNITFELIDIKMNHSLIIDKEILKLKKFIEKLQNPENKLIVGKFIFEKIKKGFKMGENFQAHKKFINSLIVTKNNNKIVTASNDYLIKVWDPYIPKNPKQEEKEKINILYSLKNGKILASKDNNILIFELNDSRQKYEVSQSMTGHNKNINALGELEDGTLISGASDKKIILWEEDPNNKQYKIKQIIDTEKEIQIILPLNQYKIAYSGCNDGIINILGTKTALDINNKIISKNYEEIYQIKEQIKGRVNCMCNLNQDYFASGGADIFEQKKLDHNIYIWKANQDKFILSQYIFNAHESDINSILLLRDGRFASSSKDRTIKIWKIDRRKTDNKIKFILHQNLKEFNHGLYKLIQMEDDRIVSTSSDNLLVFWNNTNSIF